MINMNKKTVLQHLNPLFLDGIAHRGCFDNIKIPENSMPAFKKARDQGIPIELDLHLTKDGKLVVFHDDDLRRMTGKDGVIEHLTLEELNRDYHLPNGDNLPLFQDVLDEIKEEVPLVVELKVVEKNFKPLAKAALEMLNNNIKDKNNVMVISFDPRSLWPLKGKGYVRVLLCTYQKEYRYVYRYRHTVDGVSLDKDYFRETKYRKYVKHHFVNVWTITNKEELAWVHPYVDTVTYQDMDIKEVREVLNYSKSLKAKK